MRKGVVMISKSSGARDAQSICHRRVKRGRRLAIVGLMAVAAATPAIRTSAQRGDQQATLTNLDVRLGAGRAGAAAYLARYASPASAAISQARSAGLARLGADFGSVEIVDSPELAA